MNSTIMSQEREPSVLAVYSWLNERRRKRSSGILYGGIGGGKTTSAAELAQDHYGVVLFTCKRHPSFQALVKSLLLTLNDELVGEEIAELTFKVLIEMLLSELRSQKIELIIFDNLFQLTPSQWLKLIRWLQKARVNYVGIEDKNKLEREQSSRLKVLATFRYELEAESILVSECDPTTVLECLRDKERQILTIYQSQDIGCEQLIDDRIAARNVTASFLPRGITSTAAIQQLSMSAIDIAQDLLWYTNTEKFILDQKRVWVALERLIKEGAVIKLEIFQPTKYLSASIAKLFDSRILTSHNN